MSDVAHGPLVIYYYNGAVDMQIHVPLTRCQCKASDTQVTVINNYVFARIKNETNI